MRKALLAVLLLPVSAFAGEARVESARLTSLSALSASGAPCSDVEAAEGSERYFLMAPRAAVSGGRLSVEVKVLFARCVKGGERDLARWTAVEPGAPFRYAMPRADGGYAIVSLRRDDFRLVVTEESALRVVATASFTPAGRVHEARFETALDQALSPAALAALERGEGSDLRLGLTPQARLSVSVDGGPSTPDGDRAGGGYALTVSLRGPR